MVFGRFIKTALVGIAIISTTFTTIMGQPLRSPLCEKFMGELKTNIQNNYSIVESEVNKVCNNIEYKGICNYKEDISNLIIFKESTEKICFRLKRQIIRRGIVEDMESFINGMASIFAEELHWVSCVKDVYSVYTSIRSLDGDLSRIRWSEWKTDITEIKAALGSIKDLCDDTKSAITDCDLEELGGKLGEAIAKLSNWIGEIEEATEIAIHIVNLVEDTMDVVEGIEHQNWYEVGQGVGGLINTLA
jgi:hypothetical protein